MLGNGRGCINVSAGAQLLSHVWLFATPWTVAYQAPLSLEFSSQEYWNGLSLPTLGDLPDPGIKPTSFASAGIGRRHKRCRFDVWVGTIPWRRKCQAPPVFLTGKFHRQRSLAGCSPWGLKESDTTEHARLNKLYFLWHCALKLVQKTNLIYDKEMMFKLLQFRHWQNM